MHPKKEITKVLVEGAKKKIAVFVKQRRQEYEDRLRAAYKTLPTLAPGTSGQADRWKSDNEPHTIGDMIPFTDNYRGCKSSKSVLRPHPSVGSGMGTDANPKVPKALADLQADNFFADTFISGHVMNADFGGVGSNPGNQTILTSEANSWHKSGWEAPVKRAQYYMTQVVKRLRAFQLDGTKKTIVDGIESNWRIEISGEVEDESWWDVLSTTDQGALNPTRTKIAKSITTEINFTATAKGTPTEAQLDQLKLDHNRDQWVMMVQFLESFEQLMGQVADFKLRQTPNGFGKANTESS